MQPEKNSLTYPLDFSSLHLKKAFDRNLYISSKTVFSLSVLCYDGVLCYLSNIIGQGTLIEIEENLKRFFSSEQINQAYFNLQNCLEYCLSILDSNKDEYIYNIFQQCLINLIDSTSLLSVMEILYTNKLFSYLPTFVTHDWLHMIRCVQNIEKFDITSSSSILNLRQQMSHLKEHMISLDHVVKNFNQISLTIQSPPSSSSSNDQCCLRTSCAHNTNIFQSTTVTESPSSSWSSLDIDTTPITLLSGFIRNPVTNFIMPTRPTESKMESSFLSIDGMSSDEEPEKSSSSLTRSLSYQPSRKTTGPIIVKRADVLWIYPAANIKPKYNSLFSSVYETTDQNEFEPIFKRTNSCDNDFPAKKLQNSLANKIIKKPKPIKHTKGLKRAKKFFFFVCF
jgi:hypothetical protein